jgi:hypothetical protein
MESIFLKKSTFVLCSVEHIFNFTRFSGKQVKRYFFNGRGIIEMLLTILLDWRNFSSDCLFCKVSQFIIFCIKKEKLSPQQAVEAYSIVRC